MAATIGIHWIVTTHGSWVHGDPRGSWKSGRLIGPDPFEETRVRERMSHDALVLDDVEILQVSAVWGAAIGEWGLRAYAATIRPFHAHVVFAATAKDIERVIAGLKRRSAASVLATRRTMRRPAGSHLWTARPFPVYITEDDHLRNAIEYVRDHNRRVGRPADPYPWIEPLYPAT